jgi:hypothetical protein
MAVMAGKEYLDYFLEFHSLSIMFCHGLGYLRPNCSTLTSQIALAQFLGLFEWVISSKQLPISKLLCP